ncbi:MAG TPA: ArsR family transcriptional regulator [Methanomicrobia archaeon]|nr:ArsR family transcriptional regulator [Methanomicrobia archaeon]
MSGGSVPVIFKALSSKTRMEMLRLLLQDEYHISGLANELGISVPVAAKHVKRLEDADLVHRKAFGRTHVLSANRKRLYDAMDTFSGDYEVHTQRGINILDALKEVDGIGIKKVGDKEFIASIDGEEGFYIYEVNGKSPAVPINEYTMDDGGEIQIKRLVPVLTKRVRVRIPPAENTVKKRGRE